MLRSLRLINYRGFEDTKVHFRDFTLLIGKNSSGKSTVIEALRLLSLVTLRLRTASFESAPEWTGLPIHTRGIRLSLADSDIDLGCIAFEYADDPTSFTAVFDDQTEVSGYLKAHESLFATISLRGEGLATARNHVSLVEIPLIFVMPQVAPLGRNEKLINPEYVKRNQFNPVSRLHFRNQIQYLPEHFEVFRRHAEESWPKLRIRGLTQDVEKLALMVQDETFPGEISSMGSGLQVWLQMIWFLSKVSSKGVIALDEPDVYLHADLQRKLVSLLREQTGQVLIASHSVEIMAECKPREMLVIDRKKRQSQFADSNTAVQKVIDELGGIHNIQLARLWGARKCLFVEGNDMEFLRAIARTALKAKYMKFTTIPNFPTNGWSGLNIPRGFAKTFATQYENAFETFCVLDRDYRSEYSVSSQLDQCKRDNLNLVVWARKEIENYFLCPDAIWRALRRKVPTDAALSGITPDWIREAIEAGCEELKGSTFDCLSGEILLESPEAKARGVAGSNPIARERIDKAWLTFEGRTALVGGTDLFTILNRKLGEVSKFSVGPLEVARELKPSEIPEEMVSVLRAICG